MAASPASVLLTGTTTASPSPCANTPYTYEASEDERVVLTDVPSVAVPVKVTVGRRTCSNVALKCVSFEIRCADNWNATYLSAEMSSLLICPTKA